MSRREAGSADKELPFPVLEERKLAFVSRKFWRAKRALSELPDAPPGSVLVFQHGTRYMAFEEAKHLTGAEDTVVDATAVCVVDTRTRAFTVQIPLPSESPADDFIARATFHARVTDPERAAEEGPSKITRFLTEYLEKDTKLAKLGSDHPIEDLTSVRDLVVSRIEAYCEYNPIHLPGLQVELTSASVLPSHELRQHTRELRDEQRRQAVTELKAQGEDRNIERHKGIVDGGPTALTAYGLARGETSVNDAIDNAREDELRLQAQFVETMRIFEQNGSLDYIDVDPTDMVNAYLEKLTGQPIPRRQRVQVTGSDGGKREAIASGSDGADEEPPDEDDLDE
jgi:hypothetical protein